MPSWTPEQQLAIDSEGKNIIVSAGAGSGKTAVLTERVIRKLKSGVHINELLVLTFTNAAAAEMKERIRKAIRKTPGLEEEANRIDGAYITTFDSFALSIVKKYHTVINCTSNIQITDDVVMDVLLKQVKMREDSIDSYQKAGRSDLVEKEQEEVDIIREYLPKPLTEEEIDKIIDETIAEIKPTGMSDMGKIMGIVSPKVKGKCDMKEVSSKIRERLQ